MARQKRIDVLVDIAAQQCLHRHFRRVGTIGERRVLVEEGMVDAREEALPGSRHRAEPLLSLMLMGAVLVPQTSSIIPFIGASGCSGKTSE